MPLNDRLWVQHGWSRSFAYHAWYEDDIAGSLMIFTSASMALERAGIDDHRGYFLCWCWCSFRGRLLDGGRFRSGQQYQYCIPLCLPPMLNGRRLPHQNLSIFGCWFRGDYWGFRYGGRMELPTYLPAHPLYVSLVLYRHWSARLQTTYL